jgi:hypothetical protein
VPGEEDFMCHKLASLVALSSLMFAGASTAQAAAGNKFRAPVVIKAAGDDITTNIRVNGQKAILIPNAFPDGQTYVEVTGRSTKAVLEKLSVTLPGHSRAFQVKATAADIVTGGKSKGATRLFFDSTAGGEPVTSRQIKRDGNIWVLIKGKGNFEVRASLIEQ